MGCGGLAILGAVVIVIVVIGVAIGGSGGGQQQGGTGTVSGGGGTEQQQGNSGGGGGAEQQQAAASVGETLEVGQTSWTVSEATKQQRLTGPFDETKQGNFVVIDFEFTNNANQSVTLDSGMLTLIGGGGREYSVDDDSYQFVPNNRSIIFEEVNPGVAKKGTVIFSVAPDAQDFTLEVSEGPFGTNTGKVDLGTLQ